MELELADNGEQFALADVSTMLDYMVQIPTEDGDTIWVREDQLDDLTDEELYMLLQQQPHMSGLRDRFAKMRARREARKEKRFSRREGKRMTRQERKGGTFLERIGRATEGVVGRFKGDPGGEFVPGDRGMMFPQITGGASIGVAKWWQNPMVIGIGALIIIGGVIVLSKKKK